MFPKCETSEGLCAKARDFKLMCLNRIIIQREQDALQNS